MAKKRGKGFKSEQQRRAVMALLTLGGGLAGTGALLTVPHLAGTLSMRRMMKALERGDELKKRKEFEKRFKKAKSIGRGASRPRALLAAKSISRAI